jgi:hypothetical protein
MKAKFGSIGVAGGIALNDAGTGLNVACPSCGNAASLPTPPFTFNAETLSIGPASIKFVTCGWHGYLTNGEWKESPDSTCGKPSAPQTVPAVAKEPVNVHVGDHVRFLRMANKAASLTGKIVKIHEDGVPCVDIALDDNPEIIDTAHMDDVTQI